jgi:hypothetical protein
LHVLFFGIAIVITGAKVLSAARFISTAFGGRIALVCAQFCIARFISIVAAGRLVLLGAPRFIRIAFGVRVVLVGALRFIRRALP